MDKEKEKELQVLDFSFNSNATWICDIETGQCGPVQSKESEEKD